MKILEKMKGFFSPKPKEETKRFMEVLQEYCGKYLQENQLCQETYRRYEVYYKNIYLFLSSKQLQEITLAQVKIKTMEDLRAWLFINLKTCCKRHASRHIELCKRVMKYAVMMEYSLYDPISPIKPQRDKEKDIIALDNTEIRKIKDYPYEKDYYRIVADLFIFQCYTGLSYADLYSYAATERNGKLWFEGKRQKSGENYLIYMFDEAKEIHNKYRGKMPRIANQTYNGYLKDIADLVHIRKHLTTHVGRKTHATILNERGVSTKTIADQLGNTERVVEKHYVAKNHHRIANEMTRLGIDGVFLTAS
jgi:integrase/recombinase XerD